MLPPGQQQQQPYADPGQQHHRHGILLFTYQM
jgi:hypothetical protein